MAGENGQHREQKTADECIMDHLGALFASLNENIREASQDLPHSDTSLQVRSLTLTFDGESRRRLVEDCEQKTSTRAEIFAPGINPTFSDGPVTIAFK